VDEKIDLSDIRKILDKVKESTLRSKDYYKFVIGLSTGALLISLTFIDKFSLLPAYKPLTVSGWICLIISIITGVWLLPKHDSLETQLNAIIDILSNPQNILFGFEQDINKLITRPLISYSLEKEMSKDPKNEEKIKDLKKEWLIMQNGSKGKEIFKAMMSVFEKVYPPFANAMPDITKELEKWGQFLTKRGKSMYPPYMSKSFRETIVRVERVQKAMTVSFYIGILLITLSSAISFLRIDLIDTIHNLWNNIVSLALYPRP